LVAIGLVVSEETIKMWKFMMNDGRTDAKSLHGILTRWTKKDGGKVLIMSYWIICPFEKIVRNMPLVSDVF
jgi:hypothetical protein